MAKSSNSKQSSQQKYSCPLIFANNLYSIDGAEQERHTIKLTESWALAYTGFRGAGKTFSLAYIGAKGLANNQQVFCNFNIEFNLMMPDKTIRHCQSHPLDQDALYRLDESLSNGIVLISEFQYFADSRRSMTLNNRLIDAIIAQVRKRQLFFAYDVKDMGWIDNRIRYETDVEVRCKDAYYTNWGHENGINEKGEVIFWQPQDLSGMWTGVDTEHRNYYDMPVHPMYIRVKHLRGIYDTEEIIDYIDAMAGIEIHQPKRRINAGGEEAEALAMQQRQQMVGSILKAFNVKSVWLDMDLWKHLGLEDQNTRRKYGAIMKSLGVTKKQDKHGYYYVYNEDK